MKNNSKSYKKRILTVYNLAILSYTVVGVVVFLYNMDSEKVSAGVKSNQQRKGELLHTFALSCPEQFKKLYGQQAYDDIIFRNSQINFLARNQIRDPFAVEKKGDHIIHNLNIQTPRGITEELSQKENNDRLPENNNSIQQDNNIPMQSMANINNNQQSFISPIQIYQGVENNNEDFSSNPIDYSGLNQFADQVLSSNLDSNGDNVEGIHEESLKDQIEVRFENNVIKVDLHEIDFENYTEEDGTPTILEEKKSSEYYYLESILYSYMTDLQQRAQEYREKYNMPLMLDGRMKLAESNYKEIILLAKKFQFIHKDRKRAFEIYKEMCNYKKAEKIKRDIINYVEDSPKFVQRSRNIVTNLELEPSGTIDESYNVNAQDDEKPKKIITPETEKLLLNFQQGKLDNISLVKEVQKEQEIKNQNKIYLSELIKQQKEIKDEPKDKIKEKLQQNPEFRQIERQINVHKSIVNADASEKKNLSITREKEMESRKKLSELEKKKEEFYNNEKKNLPDVNNNFPL